MRGVCPRWRYIPAGWLVVGAMAMPGAAAVGGPLPGFEERVEFSRFKLGTRFRIVFYAPGREQGSRLADLAFERVDALDRLLSDYRDDSELSSVNRLAGEAPLAVSRELFDVLAASLEVSRRSQGAFDVTAGPLVGLWRQALRSGQFPPARDLVRGGGLVGFRDLELEAGPRTVYLQRRGMKLDLGGIGKGFIADEVAVLLRSRGVSRYLIDAGGDLTVGDPPPGQAGWRVALDACGSRLEMELANRSLASSGDLYRFVEIDGIRYSHIIDPRTGRSVEGPVATAALAPSGQMADASATAVAVMEEQQILRFLDGREGWEACVSRGDGSGRRVFASPGLARLQVKAARRRGPRAPDAMRLRP